MADLFSFLVFDDIDFPGVLFTGSLYRSIEEFPEVFFFWLRTPPVQKMLKSSDFNS
jgi:hypothetical protein